MADPLDLGPELTPEADLEAAEASALAGVDPLSEAEPPEPFGRTPLFNFLEGRYVRAGGSPVFVTGHEALKQWCLMAIYTARFAHPGIFSDEFGMEEPDSVLGEAAEAQEAVSDWGERMREALLVHERIVDVQAFEATFDEDEGVVYVNMFTVVTDEEDEVPVGGLAVPVGAEDTDPGGF
jgi:hypothetical protein